MAFSTLDVDRFIGDILASCSALCSGIDFFRVVAAVDFGRAEVRVVGMSVEFTIRCCLLVDGEPIIDRDVADDPASIYRFAIDTWDRIHGVDWVIELQPPAGEVFRWAKGEKPAAGGLSHILDVVGCYIDTRTKSVLRQKDER
jgi:hypothetical protein